MNQTMSYQEMCGENFIQDLVAEDIINKNKVNTDHTVNWNAQYFCI